MEATSIYWNIFVFVTLFVLFSLAVSIGGARKQEESEKRSNF